MMTAIILIAGILGLCLFIYLLIILFWGDKA